MPLDIGSFFSMQEWSVVVEFLREKEKDLVNDMLGAAGRGEASLTAVLAGRIEELRELIDLPEYFTAAHRGIGGRENAQESNGQTD